MRKDQIFIVEDEPADIDLIVAALEDDYDLRVFTTGESAISALAEGPPDLMLLDVTLPGHDGFSVCRELKNGSSTRDVPVIILTSRTHKTDEERSLVIGAADFIRKPIEPSILRMRVRNQIQRNFRKPRQRTDTGRLLHERECDTILNLTVILLKSVDPLTGVHIEKTSEVFSRVLESYAARYGCRLELADIQAMAKASVLHDIGKVGIPHQILGKKGPLDPEEFARMQLHARIGGKIIDSLEVKLGKTPFLNYAREMALFHHEKWDGTGYPHRIGGRDIPLSARIMSLVDVYEALASRRSYRAALSHETVIRIITEGDQRIRPGHFDPEVLQAFVLVKDELRALSEAARQTPPDDSAETPTGPLAQSNTSLFRKVELPHADPHCGR